MKTFSAAIVSLQKRLQFKGLVYLPGNTTHFTAGATLYFRVHWALPGIWVVASRLNRKHLRDFPFATPTASFEAIWGELLYNLLPVEVVDIGICALMMFPGHVTQR